ncbi:T9SS type A sorting domain-containing protein [Ulvibacter litoralis]|uniref:Por secretion system C-terminal sorting domain-containing protein n=1 Tax=Ulvibacter litoralis TaxID=227084 RepID=A0A1G7GLI0_9FLAO|nr:T9SS type A sorting domain-containing protein [Ulvibacter litoralis]GHC55747.1 hypothetical protein GCM10008083_20110 [Ulvibacter litoralis]SDE88961.1 Por secretion system C-terminal sorting domain-containing protein [Ulvibacter litoralis]
MKKITLLVAALAVTAFVNAQTTMSHSTDQTDITGSVACADNTSGISTDNSFWRSYTPADFGVTDEMAVTQVEFAVGSSDFAVAPYAVTVNLYSSDATFPAGNFTLLATQQVPVLESDAGTILTATLDTPFNIDSTSEVIVEVADVDETVNFRIGQNTLGETAPSYLTSVGCAITEPTTTETIGFPDDFIINVVLDTALGLDNNSLAGVSIYPNPASDVLNVSVPSTVEVTSAVLYDVLGKDTGVSLVNGAMNTANLARGVYILSINTTAGSLTEKVVKN